MRRTDFIPNVSHFSVNECNLAIIKSDSTTLQIYDHDGKIESQFLSTKKLQSLSSCKNLFWANETEENISIFYDGKKFSNYNFNIRVVSNDLSYFIGVRDNISHRVALDGSIKWSLNDKIVNFYMDDVKIYYITRKRYVIAIDVDSGEKLWENYLGEAFDWIEKDFYNQLVNRKVSITKIIGEQNGKLWLLLSSKNILCLNSESGQNIFYFNTSFLYPDKWVDIVRRDRYLFSIYSKLDKKNGVLYDLTATTYTEIDTSLLTYMAHDAYEAAKRNNVKIFANKAQIRNNIIYADWGVFSEKFGVYSRKAKDVIWSSEIIDDEANNLGVRELKYFNKRLYIQDNAFNLHIFDTLDIDVLDYT